MIHGQSDTRPSATGSLSTPMRPHERVGRPRTKRWLDAQRPNRIFAAGYAVAAIGTAIVAITLVMANAGPRGYAIDDNWQLLARPDLAAHPLSSVWYLHTQPPLYNLFVGSVLRWSPFPVGGTLFVCYVAALAMMALLLTDLLARWGVNPVAAGCLGVVVIADPNLLRTMSIDSYEIPVATMLIAALWLIQRFVDRPRFQTLLGLSAMLTLIAMTRSLFHPVWALVVLAIVVAVRGISRRQVMAAFAVPLIVLGGWTLKNRVQFGTASLSSWVGFNLQRGVTGTLPRSKVRAAADDGAVTSLALQPPWQRLKAYMPWLDGCRASHQPRALTRQLKPPVGAEVVPNYNNRCYLSLYAESQRNALELIRRYPGAYLDSRLTVVPLSFGLSNVGYDGGLAPASDSGVKTTWMDHAANVAFLPVHRRINMRGWNQPPIVSDSFPFDLSITLVALAIWVFARGAWAVARLVRVGWHRRTTWPTEEVIWIVAAFTCFIVIIGGDLVEFGENTRFRALVDPLLIALPLGALVRVVQHVIASHRLRRSVGE